MAKKRSNAWALAFNRSDEEAGALSKLARDGLEFAQSFAENARERSAAALAGEIIPEPLTAAELAAGWTTPIYVHTAIKQARVELFGKDLSGSAMSYRLKQRRKRTRRSCAEAECTTLIPALAHGSKRYCKKHGSGRARVARHRRGKSDS
jgi:hypothetical protein